MIIMMILRQVGPHIIIHGAVIKHGAQDGLQCAHRKPSVQIRHGDSLKEARALRDCNDTAESPLLLFRRSNGLIRRKSKPPQPKTFT
jgi:hypothetical protein